MDFGRNCANGRDGGRGDLARDADADFTHLGRISNRIDSLANFARHGDTFFMFNYDLSNATNQGIFGYRVSGNALVRDSRFDATLPGPSASNRSRRYYLAFVVGARLHVTYDEWQTFGSFAPTTPNLNTVAYAIGSGSLTRRSDDDWDADPDDLSAFAVRQRSFGFAAGSKVWLRDEGDMRAFDDGVRSAADDFTLPRFPMTQARFKGTSSVASGIRQDSSTSCSSRRIRATHGCIASRLKRTPGRSSTWTLGFGTIPAGWLASGSTFSPGCYSQRVTTTPAATAPRCAPFGSSRSTYSGMRQPPTTTSLNTRRAADSGFRVAVIDPDVIGASVPDAEFSPIPVDVRSVNRITLNGTQENLGDGETWRFDVARQKLIQDPNATALTAADALVVDYAARGIAQACNPAAAVMRDAFADLRDSEGLAREDALATAEAFLDRYGTLTDRLSIEIRDNAEIAREAQTVQFDTAMLRASGSPTRPMPTGG